MGACLGLFGGLFFLYGGQELIHRGRGGRMTRNGLTALVLGMVMMVCAISTIIDPFIESGQNIFTALPFSDETKLYIICPGSIIAIGVSIVFIPLINQLIIDRNRATANRKSKNNRITKIMSYQDEWGDEICMMISNRQIGLGMTEEMVKMAWGKPTHIEDKELTQNRYITRWIYGQPRKGAKYVWFTNGKITKVKQ